MEDNTTNLSNVHNVEIRENVFTAFLNSNSPQNLVEFGKYYSS